MARYYTEISKEDFLSHIKYLMLDQEGNPNYGWIYEEERITKIIEKDISKVQFDFENCTGYKENEGYLDGYLIGYYELNPGFHTFWVSAGGDWEIPVNFMLYWGDNRLRGYVPKDGNVWNIKHKTAYGSEGDSEIFDWQENPHGPDYSNVNWDELEKSADSSKMIAEVLSHISKHPKNDEYVVKQPPVPDYTKKPKEETPDKPIQTISYPFIKPIIIHIGGSGQPFQERVETKETKIRSLERSLETALAHENYELAVQLRDEITKVKNETTVMPEVNPTKFDDDDKTIVDPNDSTFNIKRMEGEISIFIMDDTGYDDIRSVKHSDFDTFWTNIMENVFVTDHFETVGEAKDWLKSIGLTYDSSLYFDEDDEDMFFNDIIDNIKTVAIKVKDMINDPDGGYVFYSKKLKKIWWDASDGIEIEDEEIIKEQFLKIPDIDSVIVEMESSPSIFKNMSEDELDDENDYSDDWIKVNY
jgi:hypothetical protein